MASFQKVSGLLWIALLLVACSDLTKPELPPVRFSTDDCDPEFAFEDCEPDPKGWGGDRRVGYDLGSSYSWFNCWNDGPDEDMDGLKDACESRLANAFAPELHVHSDDSCLGREPYFGAKITDWHYKEVRLFYALAYYQDCGTQGHVGDSEFIVLSLLGGSNGGVWVLDRMFTSAHYGKFFEGDRSSWHLWTEIFWADVEGGRPKVVVSSGKHANFRSVGACMDTYPLDNCMWGNTRSLRPGGRSFTHSRNLGNSNNRLTNCVYSITYPERRGVECFWTKEQFDGWIDPYGWYEGAGGYRGPLADFGM